MCPYGVSQLQLSIHTQSYPVLEVTRLAKLREASDLVAVIGLTYTDSRYYLEVVGLLGMVSNHRILPFRSGP